MVAEPCIRFRCARRCGGSYLTVLGRQLSRYRNGNAALNVKLGKSASRSNWRHSGTHEDRDAVRTSDRDMKTVGHFLRGLLTCMGRYVGLYGHLISWKGINSGRTCPALDMALFETHEALALLPVNCNPSNGSSFPRNFLPTFVLSKLQAHKTNNKHSFLHSSGHIS